MDALWEFIQICIEEQGIDESHGLTHAKSCVEWVKLLYKEELDVTDDELKMAIYSAALHDMCDKKYTDVTAGLNKIRTWLLIQGWSLELSTALINIINTTSYSKLKRAMIDGTIVFPDHGIYNRVYHIVRHADLLDAYKVERCYLYQKHIVPDISDEECWVKVQALFDTRVLLYIREGWISLPAAVRIAKGLEQEALQCLNTRGFKVV
jgi:hypothetical protein